VPRGTSAVVGTTKPLGASGSVRTSLLMPLRPPGLKVSLVWPPCRALTWRPGWMSCRKGMSRFSMRSRASCSLGSSSRSSLSATWRTASMTLQVGCWEKTAATNSASHWPLAPRKAMLSSSQTVSSAATGTGSGLCGPRYDSRSDSLDEAAALAVSGFSRLSDVCCVTVGRSASAREKRRSLRVFISNSSDGLFFSEPPRS